MADQGSKKMSKGKMSGGAAQTASNKPMQQGTKSNPSSSAGQGDGSMGHPGNGGSMKGKSSK